MSYNAMELMICCAARLLEDGRTVAVGTGVPCAAAMLAQRTGAPNLVICFEAGGVAPLLPTMPISVGDHMLSISRIGYKQASHQFTAIAGAATASVAYSFHDLEHQPARPAAWIEEVRFHARRQAVGRQQLRHGDGARAAQ